MYPLFPLISPLPTPPSPLPFPCPCPIPLPSTDWKQIKFNTLLFISEVSFFFLLFFFLTFYFILSVFMSLPPTPGHWIVRTYLLKSLSDLCKLKWLNGCVTVAQMVRVCVFMYLCYCNPDFHRMYE